MIQTIHISVNTIFCIEGRALVLRAMILTKGVQIVTLYQLNVTTQIMGSWNEASIKEKK